MNPTRSGSDEIAMAQASQVLKNMLNVGNGVQTNTKDLTEPSYKSVLNMTEDVSSGRASSYECVGDKMDFQEIAFYGVEEGEQTFKINGQEVTIMTNPEQHTSSSNRVRIKSVVDFAWEQKYHMGHLIAAHPSGQYIAFALIAHKTGAGVVRVMKTKTNERTLIKGMKGQVKDLGFAYSESTVILACVDEFGTLLVYEISQQEKELHCNLLLHVQRSDVSSSDHHLIFWCSYIPEDNDEADEEMDDNSKLLAVTHNTEAEIFNISTISKKYGSDPIYTKDIPSGLMRINEHSQPITAAVFSPDGTALATASLDGEVKFFEVHLQQKEALPRCLHQWKPHGGKPISCLFFLDNYKSPNPDVQFWKFALTGTDFNQELKLWSCESWDCLQTLEFKASSNKVHSPCMKVELDSSAAYLVLSDISNRVVYVLQIYQDVSQGEARVCSIAQFPLTQAILSMAIVDAIRCRIKPLTGEVETHDKNDLERNGESESKDSEDKSKGISIKLWWINAKSLQESHITYHPPVILSQHADETMSVNSQDSVAFRDRLSDLSQDLLVDPDPVSKPFLDVELPFRQDNSSTPIHNNNNNSTNSHTVGVGSSFNNSFRSNNSGTAVGEVLLTPDDFTSPSQAQNSLTVSPVTVALTQTSNPSESLVDDIGFKNQTLPKPPSASDLKLITFPSESDPPLSTSEVGGGANVLPTVRRKSSQVSSTSSPSQEVADILAPAKPEELGAEGRSSSSPKLISPPAVSTNSFLPGLTNHLNQGVGEDRKAPPLSSWPPAPDIKDYKIPGGIPTDVNNHVPLKYVTLSSVNSTNSPLKYTVDSETKSMLQNVQDTLTSMHQSLSGLTSLVNSQAQEVQRLGEVLSRLQADRHQDERAYAQSQQELSKRVDKMDSSLYTRLEKLTNQQAASTQKKMESLLSKQWESERKLLESQVTEVSQSATLAATSKLAENVHNVVKAAVVPEVQRFLDTFRQQIIQEQTQRLSSSEAALKDSLAKLVKNKIFVDSLSSSVAATLQPQVQQTCREVLQTHLLPAVEKVCQNLFLQLNESFKNGTRDYLIQAEQFLEASSVKQSQIQTSSMQRELKDHSSAILASQQQHTIQLRDGIDKVISGSLESFGDILLQRLRVLVSEEMQGVLEAADQKGLFASSAATTLIESRSVTPAPKLIDPQILKQQILSLLKMERYNEAFQMALRATDISLVNLTIEQVPPKKLFGDSSTASLKLPVLLSLLNQLGSSMDNNTELKIQYLELALMNIDTNDANSQKNQLQVLKPLREKLMVLHNQIPPSDLNRRIKMLRMCVDGLLQSLEE